MNQQERLGNAGLSRRQLLVATGGLVVGGTFFSACGGGETTAGGGSGAGGGAAGSNKVGFAMSTFDVPRYKNVDLPAFEKAVRAGGMEPVSNQANDDAEQQFDNVQNLLSAGIGSLVLLPVVGEAAKAMVRQAVTQDVPVIAYNTAVPSGDVKAFVSRDNVAVGEAIANAALEEQGLTGKWVVVAGEAGNAVAEECTTGFMNVLQPRIDSGEVELVDEQYHKAWSPELARAQAEDALTKTGNQIDGFLCNSDGLALGVLAALKQEGVAGKIWLGGQGGDEAVCRAIVEGSMNMTSYTVYAEMGKTAGELAVKLAKGEEITAPVTYDSGDGEVPLFVIEAFNVDRANIVDYLERYSEGFVNVDNVFKGIKKSKWPEGAERLGI